MKNFIRIIFIVLGSLFFIVGMIGLLIPVFPTSPFLILSGMCYIKSSKKLYNKLIQIKYFGPHVKNYVEHRKIKRQLKWVSLLFIWFPTLITVTLILNDKFYRVVSLLIASLISLHIISLKTVD